MSFRVCDLFCEHKTGKQYYSRFKKGDDNAREQKCRENSDAEAKRGYIERGKTVCVIVQSVGEGKISGEFSFTLTSDLSEK